MAWIESHQSLGRHPKLIRLASRLGITRAAAVGHLQYLWWWAIDYAPTGNLSEMSDAEVATAADWDGDAATLRAALTSSGFLDAFGMLHDWNEYAGRLIESRRKDADRKATSRRMSTGHPADGGRTAGVPNSTQPNSTEPTQSKPKACVQKTDAQILSGNDMIVIPQDERESTQDDQNQAINGLCGHGHHEIKSGHSRAISKRFEKPKPEDVEAYAAEIGFSRPKLGHAFCDYYESGGWKIGNRPMKSWKAAVRTWKHRDESGGKHGGQKSGSATRITGSACFQPGKYDHLG